MKKFFTLFITTLLLFSCSKDDSDDTKGSTIQEKQLFGKWYVDEVKTTFGSVDMSCSTCYWEFLTEKSEDNVYGGIISNEVGEMPAFFWGTGTDGKIYVQVDAILSVKSISTSRLILASGETEFSFYKEGYQP